jgi:hypothetical protein
VAADGSAATPRLLARVSALAAVASVVVFAAIGFGGRSGPNTTAIAPTTDVVIVSVPGLRWQDLEAVESPHLHELVGAGALLSVRALGPETSRTEAYLSLDAGNRVAADGVPARLEDGRCVPDLVGAAADSADDDLNGAEPGAFGDALAAAGLPTSVFGSPAAIAALMDGDGCVSAYDPSVPSGAVPRGVVLVEYEGLDVDGPAAARRDTLQDIDAAVGALVVPDDAVVLLLAVNAIDDAAEVTVAGLSVGDAPATLSSPTTRRAGYVTLADVAPTILQTVGLEVPESMNGTVMAVAGSEHESVPDQVAEFADLAERVAFRDRAVGPVSVVMVVLLVLCGAAALGRRGRLARLLAPIVLAYPSVTFLLGLVPYHHLPLDFVVVMVPVVAAAVAAVATSALSSRGAWVPSAALAGLLWSVLVIDVATGGRLQINTPLGYTPTIAGRFQGYGNLSFGLVAGAAMVVAVVAAWAVPARRGWVLGAAAWVGAITLVADAAPRFGSDVGGTLAILPAVVVLLTVLAGRRIGWRRLVLAGVGTAVLVMMLAALDLARPAASRTHLGRFADDLLHGDGGLVIRRKLRGNLSILTSSFWSLLLVALLVAVGVLAWRRRAALVTALEHRPTTKAFLAGFVTVAVLGFALNDSGIAVPAVMLTVGVPWSVATLVPVVRRERS